MKFGTILIFAGAMNILIVLLYEKIKGENPTYLISLPFLTLTLPVFRHFLVVLKLGMMIETTIYQSG